MFYDILKKLCEEKNISPSKAATECGISRSTVTWWKQHKTSPNSEQVSKLAEYFGVSTDYLLGNEQKEKPAQAQTNTWVIDSDEPYNDNRQKK